MLNRRIQRRVSVRTLWLFVTIICLYLGLWSLTATLGSRAAANRLEAEVQFRPDSNLLDYNPFHSSHGVPVDGHFASTASPCPFVIRAEWSKSNQFSGSGGVSYFVWFFGYVIHVPGDTQYVWD